MADEQRSPDEEKGGATELVTEAKKDGEEDVAGHVAMNTPRDDRDSRAPGAQIDARDEDEDDASGHVQF
jgi:hypothetical protein